MTTTRPLLINKSDVPVYLRSGEFHQSLSDDDAEQISVPSNSLKEDTVIKNNKDLHHLLSSLRFWGVDNVVEEVIIYCFSEFQTPCTDTLKEFERDFPYVLFLTTILSVNEELKMLSAVKSGILEIVRNLPEDISIHANCCLVAAKAGNLEILQCLHRRGCNLDTSVLDAALRGGKGLTCVQYMKEMGLEWPSKALVSALLAGSRDCFHYALQHGCTWELYGGSELCEDKYADTLRYAIQHGLHASGNLAGAAAGNGAIQCLQILHEFDCPWNFLACELAAGQGHLECLQFLHNHGCPWDESATTAAAETGQLDCLRYLHEQGCPWNVNAYIEAVLIENMDVLTYLFDNGCPSDSRFCTMAASRGQLEMLMFLHERGSPWEGQAVYWAVHDNHIECVQYALQQGCPVHQSDTCALAATKGFLKVLQVLHQAGIRWDKNSCNAAATSGHLDCLRYLRENGCPWSKSLCSDAALHGKLDCLEYLHSQGCPLGEDVGLFAAIRGHLDCLQYAHKHGAVAWHKDIFRKTLENEQLECLKYLMENGCPIDTEVCAEAACLQMQLRWSDPSPRNCFKSNSQLMCILYHCFCEYCYILNF